MRLPKFVEYLEIAGRPSSTWTFQQQQHQLKLVRDSWNGLRAMRNMIIPPWRRDREFFNSEFRIQNSELFWHRDLAGFRNLGGFFYLQKVIFPLLKGF